MIKGKDILTLEEISEEEILKILDLADKLKREKKAGLFRPLLKNNSVALIFQKPSTRTRVSFETGIFELGGNALNLSANELQLARGETIEDTARTLSRYVDAIMARVNQHIDVVKLADASSVPVINGLSHSHHPCQILADLQTIREFKGELKGLKLAWVGDGDNVCNTLLIGCSKLGINMSVATPEKFQPSSDILKVSNELAGKSNSKIIITEDPFHAVEGADIVVTDTFVSMGTEAEKEVRLKSFFPKYQVTRNLMGRAKSNAIFMHCLPAHRGEEVTDEVIDGKQSVVWQEAENRLHSQKALLCLLLLEEEKLRY